MISQEKYKEIHQAYMIHGSISKVAKLCSVSPITVRKYYKKDKWKKDLQDIKRQTVAKTKRDRVSILSENINILRDIKSYLVQKIKELHKQNLLDGDVKNLVQVVRLESELSGELKLHGDEIFNIYTMLGGHNGDSTNRELETEFAKKSAIVGSGNGRPVNRL